MQVLATALAVGLAYASNYFANTGVRIAAWTLILSGWGIVLILSTMTWEGENR